MSDLKKIWDKGVSIGALYFAPVDAGAMRIEPTSEDTPCTDYFSGMETWEFQTEFREKMVSGLWSAVGYRSPRRPNSPLELITRDLFREGEFNYSHSGISGDGLSYVGIRIVHSSFLDDFVPAQSKGPGRPTREMDILEAYEDLARRSAIDFNGSRADMARQIQQWLLSNRRNPSDKPLAGAGIDTVISKIRSRFDKDRKNYKSKTDL